MPSALTTVPDPVARAVICEALEPYLPRFERLHRCQIAVDVHQWADGRSVPVCSLASRRKSGSSHVAKGRLLFRPNYGGDLFNFNVHVLFPDSIAPGTGCSGFSVNGWVRHCEEPPTVEVRGWTILYNQPDLATEVV